MNVLLVTTSYPLDSESSSGIFVKRLKDALGKYCYVEVVCPDDSSDKPVYEKGLCRSRYGFKRWQTLAHGPGGIPAAIRRDRRYLFLVPFLLLSMQISIFRRLPATDLIFANWSMNAIVAWLPAWLFGKPIVTALRGEDVRNLSKRTQSLIIWGVLRASDRVILVSDDMARSLSKRFPRYKHKFRVIHNGVDGGLLEFSPAVLGAHPDRLHMLTVASLIPRKDIKTLISAFSTVIKSLGTERNVELSIVGGGELEQPLRALSAELGVADKVRFWGMLSPEITYEMYARSELFVLPSLHEGRPNVVVEAMAAGCCVVASDIHGCRELISESNNGLLFTAGDEKELTNQLLKVLSNGILMRQLGASAREYVIHNRLSWDGCAQKYYQVFCDIVKK